MMRPIIIHYRASTARHIPRKALRSSLRLLVTCKVCQRKHWPGLTKGSV